MDGLGAIGGLHTAGPLTWSGSLGYGPLLSALGYAGEVADKQLGGRAVRGLLGGRPRELLSLVPGSDALGITDPARRVSGEDLVTGYGLASPGSWGATLGGVAADAVLDPATLALGGVKAATGLSRASRAIEEARGGGALARRLAGLQGPPALDRRLAELGKGVDPIDRLRVQVQPAPPAPAGALSRLLSGGR